MDSSRRGFLKLMGIGAAIAAVPAPVRAALFEAPAAAPVVAPVVVEAAPVAAVVGNQFINAQEYANAMLLLVKQNLKIARAVSYT